MLVARRSHALVWLNNQVYMFGGYEYSCEVHSLDENRWSNLDPTPINPGATVATLYKKEIWVTGHETLTISAFDPIPQRHRIINVELPSNNDRIMLVYGSNLYVITADENIIKFNGDETHIQTLDTGDVPMFWWVASTPNFDGASFYFVECIGKLFEFNVKKEKLTEVRKLWESDRQN